jgi:hypothetical protein
MELVRILEMDDEIYVTDASRELIPAISPPLSVR